jgi:hypothetical protein
MQYYTLKQEDDLAAFVEFWARRYNDKSEPTYRECIKRPLTPESVRKLLAWKAMQINRKSIEAGEHPFVETVISSLDRFQSLQLNTPDDADNFLTNELKDKGMIWKIFTLHIMYPDRYPIFDQNVYRAMHYLKIGIIKEIPSKNKNKQQSYINEYLPFYNEYGYYEDRKLDKALFTFGRFLKIFPAMDKEHPANRGDFKTG